MNLSPAALVTTKNWQVLDESSYWSMQEPLGHQWGAKMTCLDQEAWVLQPSTAAPWPDHSKHWFIKDFLSFEFCSIIKFTYTWPTLVKRLGMSDKLCFTFSRKVFGGIPAGVEISIQYFSTDLSNCNSREKKSPRHLRKWTWRSPQGSVCSRHCYLSH